jgi:hypothetical protein
MRAHTQGRARRFGRAHAIYAQEFGTRHPRSAVLYHLARDPPLPSPPSLPPAPAHTCTSHHQLIRLLLPLRAPARPICLCLAVTLTLAPAHTNKHTHARMNARTHARTRALARTHASACAHARAYTQTLAHKHHACAHARRSGDRPEHRQREESGSGLHARLCSDENGRAVPARVRRAAQDGEERCEGQENGQEKVDGREKEEVNRFCRRGVVGAATLPRRPGASTCSRRIQVTGLSPREYYSMRVRASA